MDELINPADSSQKIDGSASALNEIQGKHLYKETDQINIHSFIHSFTPKICLGRYVQLYFEFDHENWALETTNNRPRLGISLIRINRNQKESKKIKRNQKESKNIKDFFLHKNHILKNLEIFKIISLKKY